jgi:hypothetical protein
MTELTVSRAQGFVKLRRVVAHIVGNQTSDGVRITVNEKDQTPNVIFVTTDEISDIIRFLENSP